jgi:hypothetical protein
MKKTDDGFMSKTYGYAESEHEKIGRNRRKVWRLYNQPQHYCVEPSPEFGCLLPEYCVTAWMSSGPIPGRDASPSKMVIVFFCDYIAGMYPEGLFTLNLYNFDWDAKAWTANEIEQDRGRYQVTVPERAQSALKNQRFYCISIVMKIHSEIHLSFT